MRRKIVFIFVFIIISWAYATEIASTKIGTFGRILQYNSLEPIEGAEVYIYIQPYSLPQWNGHKLSRSDAYCITDKYGRFIFYSYLYRFYLNFYKQDKLNVTIFIKHKDYYPRFAFLAVNIRKSISQLNLNIKRPILLAKKNTALVPNILKNMTKEKYVKLDGTEWDIEAMVKNAEDLSIINKANIYYSFNKSIIAGKVKSDKNGIFHIKLKEPYVPISQYYKTFLNSIDIIIFKENFIPSYYSKKFYVYSSNEDLNKFLGKLDDALYVVPENGCEYMLIKIFFPVPKGASDFDMPCF